MRCFLFFDFHIFRLILTFLTHDDGIRGLFSDLIPGLRDFPTCDEDIIRDCDEDIISGSTQ